MPIHFRGNGGGQGVRQLEEVLTPGERDIKANWRRYRAAYELKMRS